MNDFTNINIFENTSAFSLPTESNTFAPADLDDGPSGTNFTTFSGSDSGDPHLSDSYTTAAGVTGTQKWDDMSGISNLLSGSQFGGFHYSTGVTPKNSGGVTLNDQFTAQFGNGSSIDMNTNGAPTIEIDGTAQQMQTGQTYEINDSTTATWDGSKLTISQKSGDSSLTTTVANDGGHLDINASGSEVNLNGALAGNQAPTNPVAFHPPQSDDETDGDAEIRTA